MVDCCSRQARCRPSLAACRTERATASTGSWSSTSAGISRRRSGGLREGSDNACRMSALPGANVAAVRACRARESWPCRTLSQASSSTASSARRAEPCPPPTVAPARASLNSCSHWPDSKSSTRRRRVEGSVPGAKPSCGLAGGFIAPYRAAAWQLASPPSSG